MKLPKDDYLNSLIKEVTEKSVAQTHTAQLEGNLLIDIRDSEELGEGSPKDAITISKGNLETNISKHVQSLTSPIYLICQSGRRSLFAAKSLKDMGYAQVFSVAGGYNEWKNRGLPIDTGKSNGKNRMHRYKRHIMLEEVGETGQQKLLDSKVLIIGAGGIGCPTSLYLAAAGIGTIGIIDNDVIDITNLQRQILYTEMDVGRYKVDIAKRKLLNLDSSINVISYKERLDIYNVEKIFSEYDIILDGTDNFNTRYLINDACVKLGIPNIHGSVFQFDGQVSVFYPQYKEGNSPCYRCVFPSPPPVEMAPSCAEAGVFGVLPGLIGLFCAKEALKLILDIGQPLIGKLLVLDTLSSSFETFEIDQNPECTYCNCNDKEEYPKYQEIVEACSL